MYRIKSITAILIGFSFLFAACGLNAEQVASTNTAQTAAAAPPTFPPTETALPSNTPLPTDTATPAPTDTPTLTPTETPLPTDTPTITPTPGPFSFMDDFSTNSGGWEGCDLCKWENGGLLLGPFPPTSNFHKYACTGCGERTFYTVKVDGTFVDGQVDRFFGIFAGDANGEQYYLGISPWQFYAIGKHIDEGDSWTGVKIEWSGLVNPSYATNTFEIAIQPSTNTNLADVFFTLNGSNIYVLDSQPVAPSKTGIAMDWHAVTANYDNWSYVEIEP